VGFNERNALLRRQLLDFLFQQPRGQSLLKAAWLPEILARFACELQLSLLCPESPHLAQMAFPLELFWPWQNFCQLKQHSGLGK